MNKLLSRGAHHLKHLFASGALILVYHRINESALDPWSLSVRPDHFAEHLSVLRRSFHLTSLQALVKSLRGEAILKPKSIVITFDDGYADNLHFAKPLLERFDCPATVFIVTGAIGSPFEFWWDELASLLLYPHPLPERLDLSINGESYSWQLGSATKYGPADYAQYVHWRADQPAPTFRHTLYRQLWQLLQQLSSENQSEVMKALRTWVGSESNQPTHRILDYKEFVELAQAEHIEIGAHTIHHPSLPSLPYTTQGKEISGSKSELEKLLKKPVTAFSYPFGKRQDYSPETISLVQDAGFSAACSCESRVINSATNTFQLPRIRVPDCSKAEFESRLISKFYA